MTYYAPKPPPERDPYGKGSRYRDPNQQSGLDADSCMNGWGCETLGCLSFLACGWPCSLTLASGLAVALAAILLAT